MEKVTRGHNNMAKNARYCLKIRKVLNGIVFRKGKAKFNQISKMFLHYTTD